MSYGFWKLLFEKVEEHVPPRVDLAAKIGPENCATKISERSPKRSKNGRVDEFFWQGLVFTSYKVQYQSFGASIPKKGDLPIGIDDLSDNNPRECSR